MTIYVPGKLTLKKEFTVQDYMWNFPQQYGLWSPAEITTALWLDAADASTITESGGAVSEWSDKSGNGRNAVQPSPSVQPFYDTTGIGGLQSVEFGGGDKRLNLPILSTGAYSWFFALGQQSGSTISVFGNNLSYIPIAADSSSTNKIRVNNVNDPAGAVQLYNGETSQSVITRGDIYSQLTSANNCIVGFLNIPSTSAFTLGYATVNYGLNGYMGEVIIVSGEPAVVIRQKIEGYLAHKWGLTANLPAGHPYKLVGPTP